MILVLTAKDLVERARHKGADAVTLDDIAGVGRMSGSEVGRLAERIVFVKPSRFKVLKDRSGPDADRAGYITSTGRNNLAVLLALWAEEDAAR
jgi:hypothetical protein